MKYGMVSKSVTNIPLKIDVETSGNVEVTRGGVQVTTKQKFDIPVMVLLVPGHILIGRTSHIAYMFVESVVGTHESRIKDLTNERELTVSDDLIRNTMWHVREV